MKNIYNKFCNLFTIIYPPNHLHFYFQRLILNIRLRKYITKYLSARLPQLLNKNVDPSNKLKSLELNQNGISFFPNFINNAQIDDIKNYCDEKLFYDRTRPENGSFLIKNAPANCHVAALTQNYIIACPHILDIANEPNILEIVSNQFTCKPTISNISIWWSLPGHSQPENAEFFHRDVDDWHFIKLFI